MNKNLNQLLQKEMTRKHFMRLVAIATISVLGFGGMISFLLAHAASPDVSEEAEDGTLNSNATIGSDTNASGDKFVKFGTAPSGGGSGTPTPYATAAGVTVTGIILQEEFDGGPTAIVGGSGGYDTTNDTVSASGLGTGSDGLDVTVWSPYYYEDGGTNDGSGTYSANVLVNVNGDSLVHLKQSTLSQGAALYSAGSIAGTNEYGQSMTDYVSGHKGMPLFNWPCLIEWYGTFNQDSAGNGMANWPGNYVTGYDGKEMDMCEVNNYPEGGADDVGKIMLNLHSPGEVITEDNRPYSNVVLTEPGQAVGQISTGWHHLSINWQEDFIDVFIDNVKVVNATPDLSPIHTATASAAHMSSDNGVFFILIQGSDAPSNGQLGPVGGEGLAPCEMDIDWVHIFQVEAQSA